MKNQKIFIIAVALIVVALGAYLYFSKSDSTTATTPTTNTLASSNTGTNPVALGDTTTTATSFAGSEIATLLKNISQIKLDTGILQNPSFLSLVDTTQTLPETKLSGRINPFSKSAALDNAAPDNTQINDDTSVGASVDDTPTTTITTPKTR